MATKAAKIAVAAGAGAILYFLFSGKKASAAQVPSGSKTPGPGTGTKTPGPGTPTPPAAPKQYVYKIAGSSSDMAPFALTQAWVGQQTTARLDELVAANPNDLRHGYLVTMEYVADDGRRVSQTLAGAQEGQYGSVSVNPGTPNGQYPNNPIAGTTGYWNRQASLPTLLPWNKGQLVKIPTSWGAPPASLVGNTTQVG